MRNVEKYDFLLRLFHWCFVCLFGLTFTIGHLADDKNIIFGFHAIIGIVMSILIIVRIGFGLSSSSQLNFEFYDLKLSNLIKYLKSNMYRGTKVNPATSFASVFIFSGVLLAASSGVLYVQWQHKLFKEAHELIVMGLSVVVGLHILGVILHRIKFGSDLISKMTFCTSFRLRDVYRKKVITTVIFFSLMIFVFASLIVNYDTNSGNLVIGGTSLKLIEER